MSWKVCPRQRGRALFCFRAPKRFPSALGSHTGHSSSRQASQTCCWHQPQLQDLGISAHECLIVDHRQEASAQLKALARALLIVTSPQAQRLLDSLHALPRNPHLKGDTIFPLFSNMLSEVQSLNAVLKLALQVQNGAFHAALLKFSQSASTLHGNFLNPGQKLPQPCPKNASP